MGCAATALLPGESACARSSALPEEQQRLPAMAHVIRISYKPQYQPRFDYSEEEEARYALMTKDVVKRCGQRLTLGLLTGIRVDPSLAPRTARQTSDHKKLYDFVPTRNGWLLSRRAMELIESIDRGIHQFIPFDLRLKDGSPAPEPRWIFNNCAQIDTAIAPEHSTVGAVTPDQPYWFFAFKAGPRKGAVYKDKVAHRAIWSDRRFERLFVSDLFWNELQKLGIKEIESVLPAPEV